MFEDLKNIKSSKKELRNFGLNVGIIFIVLGALVMWRGRRELSPYLFTTGILLVVLGLRVPEVLKPLQKIWMGFSIVVGFFVSRFILIVLFYAVLTPIGLIARLLGKDILDQRIDRSSLTYWRERTGGMGTKGGYENQY